MRPEQGGRVPDAPLLRFDAVERAAHWATAALFVTLMATGAALYVGPLSEIVGRHGLVRTVHVFAGFGLPAPLLLATAGRWGMRLRADLGRLNRWTRDDARWFRHRHRTTQPVRSGKFNAGQKLNAAFLGGAAAVMLGTGALLFWHRSFPLDWRTGATFVHDWFALGIWVSVLGHVWMATRERVVLDGMIHGRVPADWARRRAPRWYADERRGGDGSVARVSVTSSGNAGSPPDPGR